MKNSGANNPTVVDDHSSNPIGADVNSYSNYYAIPKMNIPDANGNLVITDPNLANLQIYYQSLTDLSYYSTNLNSVNYSVGTPQLEVALDTQAIHAIAPYVNIIVVVVPSLGILYCQAAILFAHNVLTKFNNIVAVSMSFGGGRVNNEPHLQRQYCINR